MVKAASVVEWAAEIAAQVAAALAALAAPVVAAIVARVVLVPILGAVMAVRIVGPQRRAVLPWKRSKRGAREEIAWRHRPMSFKGRCAPDRRFPLTESRAEVVVFELPHHIQLAFFRIP